MFIAIIIREIITIATAKSKYFNFIIKVIFKYYFFKHFNYSNYLNFLLKKIINNEDFI